MTLFLCIILNVRSAVAYESATELHSCNILCSSGGHSMKNSFEEIISQIVSTFVIFKLDRQLYLFYILMDIGNF